MVDTQIISRKIALKFDIDNNISLSEFEENKKYRDETKVLYDMFVLDDGYQWIGNLIRFLITHHIVSNLNLPIDYQANSTDT